MKKNKKSARKGTNLAHAPEYVRYWTLQALKDDLFAVVNANKRIWGRETWIALRYAMRSNTYSAVREILAAQQDSPSKAHGIILCGDIMAFSQSLGLAC